MFILITVGMAALIWTAGFLWAWFVGGTSALMSILSGTFWKQSINEKKERTGK